MELEVKEALVLEDGKHTGSIERVEYREEPYRYTDIFIKEDTTQFELKYGCPTSQSINSKLMKLIGRFVELKQGLKINPEKILVGKEVSFMTMTDETERGTFIKIVDNSIKPRAEELKVAS